MPRSWDDKLHNATQVLLTAVTELHTNGKDEPLLRLVNSVSDVVHLVEQLNVKHRNLASKLQRERERSSKILERLEVLEKRYEQSEIDTSRPQSQESEQLGNPCVNSTAVDNGKERDLAFQERGPVGNQHFNISQRKDLPKTPPQTPPPPSPAKKETVSPYKPPPPVKLPPLPTLREVQAEQRERRSQKRALSSQKPPPCDKCRLRKRAMMLREHGFVKEHVFMRWSKRPGACLQFMHYDEPLPEGENDGNRNSFPDTETQSPE